MKPGEFLRDVLVGILLVYIVVLTTCGLPVRVDGVEHWIHVGRE